MEAVPRLPMISFELLQTGEKVSFGPKLKPYIASFYQEDPETYTNEIHNLEGLRASAVWPSVDINSCQIMKRYYCQLHFLKSRFPMEENQISSVYFSWKDDFTKMSCTVPDINFELMCILINIGAIHMKLGAEDRRNTPEGMKISCTHFQCAAWAYQHACETYGQMIGLIMVAVEQVRAMQIVSLAQAQECILEKSLLDNRKPTIIAKIAVQTMDYYRQALHTFLNGEDGRISDHFPNNKYLVQYLNFKVMYHRCIALLYQGQQAEEQQKMGERVAFYAAALEALQDANKYVSKMSSSNQALFKDTIAFTLDVVEGKRKAATNENEFIYHEDVPSLDSLQEVKGASLVKGIPFNVQDIEVSGPDIFGRLVPMEAHEASSLYSEQKAQMLRKMGERVEKRDQDLNEFMSSLQLDVLNQMKNAKGLTQELVDRAAEMVARPNATKDLVDVMGKLSNSYQEVESMLREIQQLLYEEEEAEKHYQEIMGKRPPSIIATDLSREAAKYHEAHNKASESNQNLHKAMTTHVANLKILSQPISQLRLQIPSLHLPDPNVDEGVINQMEMLINKVDEMKKQRINLWNQLRDAVHQDDITGALVTRPPDQPLDLFFQQQLDKHTKAATLLEQNLIAQENICKAIVDYYAQFTPTRKYLQDFIYKRNSTITALNASYDTYDDLLAKANKGIEFYSKLETNVSKLLQRVKSAFKVQQEEREQMLIKNGHTSSAPKNEVEAPINSKPKLKDYLDSMKEKNLNPYPSQNVDQVLAEKMNGLKVTQYDYAGTYSYANYSNPPTSYQTVSSTNYPYVSVSEQYTPNGVGNATNSTYATYTTATTPAVTTGGVNSYYTQPDTQVKQDYYNYGGTSSYYQQPYDKYQIENSQYPTYSQNYPTSSAYDATSQYTTTAQSSTDYNQYGYGQHDNAPTSAYSNMKNTFVNDSSASTTTGVTQSYNSAYAPQSNPAYNMYSQQNNPGYNQQNTGRFVVPNSTGFVTQDNTGYLHPNSTGFAQQNSSGFNQQDTTNFTPQNNSGFAEQNTTGYVQHNIGGYNQQNNAGFPQQQNSTGFTQPNNIAFTQQNLDYTQQTSSGYNQQNNSVYIQQNSGLAHQSTSPYPQQYSSGYEPQDNSTFTHQNSTLPNQEVSYGPQNPAYIYDQNNLALQNNTSAFPQHNPVYTQYDNSTPAIQANPDYTLTNTSVIPPQSIPSPGTHQNNPTESNQYYSSQNRADLSQAISTLPAADTYYSTTQATAYQYPTDSAQINYSGYYPSPQYYNSQYSSTATYTQPIAQPSTTTQPKKESSIDLLAGLDFSINQAPLIPQKETKTENKPELNDPPPSKKSNSSEEKKIPEIKPIKKKILKKGQPFENPDIIKQFLVEVDKFEKYVEGLNVKTLNGPSNLELKWKEIQDSQDNFVDKSISVARCYPLKNRSPDILPYDHTRVELRTTKDDYINASHIRDVNPFCMDFIVTQNPTKETLVEFWAMVWEQQVELIVCLLSNNEINQEVYWPLEVGKELIIDTKSIAMLSCVEKEGWTERRLNVAMFEEKESRIITILQYNAWPGSLFPTDPSSFINFLKRIISCFEQQRNVANPVLLHCLVGVGRSGICAVLLAVLMEFSATGCPLPDIPFIASKMSRARKNILRDREHLKFVYMALLTCVQSIKRDYTKSDIEKAEDKVPVEKVPVDPLSELDPLWATKKA